jgi:predicted phage gp36 major capsid-like protein
MEKEIFENALTEIKGKVDAKFEGVAKSSDLEVKADKKDLETKANVSDVVELKNTLEAIEAKFDAIPMKGVETKATFDFGEEFKKGDIDLEIKSITESSGVTGAPVNAYGLKGDKFEANVFRKFAQKFHTNSGSIMLPRITGSHGAMVANASNKESALTGDAAVAEINVVLETIRATGQATVESVNDVIDFDRVWSQNMINALAAREAAQHVTVVEAIAGETAGSATALTLDDLANLIYAVGPEYRTDGKLVVSTSAMQQIRTLNQSGTGSELLFDASIGAFRLFGYPVFENGRMASVAANAVVAAFGDFEEGLALAVNGTASVQKNEFTTPGYYTYNATMRSKLAVKNANAVKTLTMAAS